MQESANKNGKKCVVQAFVRAGKSTPYPKNTHHFSSYLL
jgi:hypothetical protein